MNKEEKPYLFISYSHKDFDEISKLITALKHVACNIWYDSGIEKGSQWSEDIATHLLNSECVMWFVSKESIESKYVLGELNFAISHDKRIIPVFIENVPLPLGIELLLGQIQAVNLYSMERFSEKRNALISALPSTVFFQATIPFFASGANIFFINDTSKEFPEGTYFAGETDYSYNVGFSNTGGTDEQTALFGWHIAGGYDMLAKITSVQITKDEYINELDGCSVIVNISLMLSGKYPVPWPDIDIALSIVIYDADTETPKFNLFGARILTINGKSPKSDEKAYSFASQTLNGIVQEINKA